MCRRSRNSYGDYTTPLKGSSQNGFIQGARSGQGILKGHFTTAKRSIEGAREATNEYSFPGVTAQPAQ